MSKRCNICKEERDLSEFYKDRHSRDNLQKKCKKCHVIQNRKFSKKRNRNGLAVGFPEKEIMRFESKIIPEPNSGCWLWLASIRYGLGYGTISYKGKQIQAGKFALLIYKGIYDENLHALHKCDNPFSANPDHMFLGTNRDNCLDKARKGRIPQAKLNPDSVRQARILLREGLTHAAIAARFKVSRFAITQMAAGKSWVHVQ